MKEIIREHRFWQSQVPPRYEPCHKYGIPAVLVFSMHQPKHAMMS